MRYCFKILDSRVGRYNNDYTEMRETIVLVVLEIQKIHLHTFLGFFYRQGREMRISLFLESSKSLTVVGPTLWYHSFVLRYMVHRRITGETRNF